MGLLEDVLIGLGIIRLSKTRKRTGNINLPPPDEIKKKLEEVVEGLSGLKEAPKTIIDRLVEADSDFREADRALRGARFKGRRR